MSTIIVPYQLVFLRMNAVVVVAVALVEEVSMCIAFWSVSRRCQHRWLRLKLHCCCGNSTVSTSPRGARNVSPTTSKQLWCRSWLRGVGVYPKVARAQSHVTRYLEEISHSVLPLGRHGLLGDDSEYLSNIGPCHDRSFLEP